ncbi:cubilin-like, partial [Stegodyphus dumicola]|uniref:cubilin-like n=1 Tax=Stegodyphus dumicola TaxID=202533 RepID=UPI0015AF71B7
MREKWVLWLQCLILISLGVFATDSGFKDPFPQQPRIVVQDGNLILQSAFNRNVSIATSGQGNIVVNNVDLGRTIGRVHTNHASQSSTLAEIRNQISDLSEKWKSLNDLTLRVSALEENVTDIANKINQFVGSGQNSISNRGIRSTISKVQELSDSVSTLTQLLTVNECTNSPCRNGGTCIDAYNGYICICPSNWEGVTCETDVNECAVYAGTSFGCQNGATCINTQGGYSCQCANNWNGIHCNQKFDDCSMASHQELCGHGTCINEKRVQPGQPKYRCLCDPGWQSSSSSPACTQDIDECSGPQKRCSQNPPVTCINLPGTFHCGPCPEGYTGDGHSCTDINECEVNNGGCSMHPFVQCTNTIGSRTCGSCPTGYVGNGVHCSFVGICALNHGGCHPLATCIENTAITSTYRECRCPSGYIGSGEGLQGCVQSPAMSCLANPCIHGTCESSGPSARCICFPGYHGILCEQEEDPCISEPCQNGGTCFSRQGNFTCVCSEGFEGQTCARSRESCGGFLNGNNGTLEFPENGVHYNHMMDCAWVITVDDDKVVNITFEHFDLESGLNCEFDFLQLNDGPNAASHVIGRFCQEDLQNRTFVSTHNQLYLWFRSDRTAAATGFSLNWTATKPVCGGYLWGHLYGSVNSPGYPGKYPRNRTCTWSVIVPIGKRIQFVFATMMLEHHENCSYDYLKVYDGARFTDPEIGTYCSSVIPPPLTTSGHMALLHFHSDESNEDAGFHIAYSAIATHGCGGTLTAPQGIVTSPNFPDVYDSYLRCEWIIRVRPGSRILLTFQEFNLGSEQNCWYDRLEVYDGNSDAAPVLGRFCASTLPSKILANSNNLYIKFQSSDANNGRTGFKVKYETICGGIYTDLTGVLSSPNYPETYPERCLCIYEIRLPPGYVVNVTFHSMFIRWSWKCESDYLDIHDGDSSNAPRLAHLCGNEKQDIISSYNVMWMKFKANSPRPPLRGFYIVYEGMEMGCGGLLTDNEGRISSPKHPLRYPHSHTCRWLLRAPEKHSIRLTFTSFYLEEDNECRFDYVDIEESNGMSLGRYCGNRIPPILTSVHNTLIVKFVTDASVARDGFTANYTFFDTSTECGGTYYQESGVIRSPGFPNNYPSNSKCVWIIQAKPYRQIILNITHFRLETGTICTYDYLEIRNGGSQVSPLIGKYCDQIGHEVKSHSNMLWLKFVSDYIVESTGFEIFFESTSVGCGGMLTSASGEIGLPDNSLSYDCEWHIRISAGSLIFLIINEMNIEEEETCLNAYLQIFDGDSENSRSVLRICNGQQNPGTITSTGNSMLLRYRSDGTRQAGSFRVYYTTACTVTLTKRSGVIESPNFPDYFGNRAFCRWVIKAPQGNNITMSFSHLFFRYHSNYCASLNLKIKEVDEYERDHSLFSNCGVPNTLLPTIETSTSKAIVEFIYSWGPKVRFRLEWIMKGCGGDIENTNSGFITSPNYPNGYPLKTTCLWHIFYAPGERVQLTILELDLQGEEECASDYVRVYGGENENSPPLLNACHRISGSQIVTSHGNHMVVHFNSDTNIRGRGFKASYRKLSAGCGGKFTAGESTIMSPNYPDPYNANDECEWLIQVSLGHRVQLKFYDFELPLATDCTLGHVAIHDGRNSNAPLLAKYCGAKPEEIIFSTSNQMLVKLVADGTNVGKGFRAHYKTGCGSRLLADEGGEIMSPNYPHGSPDFINCSWIIYTSEPAEKVSLLVTHLELENSENCSSASLTIKNGDMPDSPISSVYCGRSSPPLIISSGNILQVILQNHGIFRATYGSASSNCGGTYKSPEGVFTTPGYPLDYPLSMECIWTMEASPGSKIHISFLNFHLEVSEHCNKDYVEIREKVESGRLIGRYCGSQVPSNVTDAQKLWIKFRSDDIDSSNGFYAQYIIQPSNVLNGTEGEIASPSYPHKYTFSNVEWTVIVPSGMFVSVRFFDFGIADISTSHSCMSSLNIYDGFDDTAPSLGELCGYHIPEPLVSTGNVIFIRLVVDHRYAASFHLQWAAVTESGVVESPSAEDSCWTELRLNASTPIVVQSPNYPGNYPDNTNCTYIIRTSYSQHVELNITDFQLEDWFTECSTDRLEVYYALNPNVDSWHLNASLCGRGVSPYIVSPTNLMKLQFITDSHTNFRGFSATAISKCGGRLTDSHGVIMSEYINHHIPDINYGFPTVICEWYIQVKPGRTIQLSFSRFHIFSDHTCGTNYILIRNGGSRASPVLGHGRYCGLTIPNLPETTSNEAYVKVVITAPLLSLPSFELRYAQFSLGCGSRIDLNQRSQSAEILSQNYPAAPPPHMECEWTVMSPPGTRIRMDFENRFNMIG